MPDMNSESTPGKNTGKPVRSLTSKSQLLKSLNSAVICWRLDGTITFVNEFAQNFFGYSSKELLGKNVSILLPSAKSDFDKLLDDITTNPDKYANHQNENITRDGRIVWMAWTNKPILDDNGNLIGVVAVGNDISERRKFEQSMRHSRATYRALARNFSGAVFVLDREMRYVVADGLSLSKIGFTREQLEGKKVSQLDPDTRELIEPRCRRALAGETFVCEDEYNGRIVTTHYTPVLDDNDEVMQIAVTLHDVTDLKKTQQKLVETNDELEERVQQRTSELLSTVEALQDEVRLRELAERKLTHTNRELNKRARQLAHLASELTRAEERERQRIAQILHDHLQQLLLAGKLNLGLLSRQLEHPGHINRVQDVISLIEQCIDESRSLTVELSPPVLYEAGIVPALKWLARWKKENHALQVNLHLPEKVDAGPQTSVLIFQTVRELLLNTVKHAKAENAFVTIKQSPKTIAVTISDDGIGFDVDEMWAAAAQSDTAGFGLFSIRERLHLLGGSCCIESSPGKGAKFTLTVPHTSTPQPEHPVRQPITETATLKPAACTLDRKIRILIADDHQVLRNGLASMLNYEKDMEVVGQATNGQQAVELARKLAPELILMDVGMPTMNGIEATKIIASEMPEISVFALSMFDDDERVAEMFNAGAIAYATKSQAPETLIASIRNHKQSSGEKPCIPIKTLKNKLDPKQSSFSNRLRQKAQSDEDSALA